jgi:hypothetical protein
MRLTQTFASFYRTIQQRVPRASDRTPAPWDRGAVERKEVRKSERLAYPLYALYQDITLVPTEPRAARVLNVSAEGLGLLTQGPLEEGEVLGVELQSASGKPECRLRARVVHVTRRSAELWLIGCSVLGEATMTE